ncbi:MAG: lysylphosphatidylglycerol synthase domain-containing protein, partial [Thermoleophilaceae bacterium]
CTSFSYVLLYRAQLAAKLADRRLEQAMGSLIPASGAGGLALGAWVLSRGGLDSDPTARRSVAFFMIKSSVNFVAVALLGAAMALGLLGPDLPLWLTAFPATLAALALVGVAALPRLGPRRPPAEGAGRIRRGAHAARRALLDGSAEAVQILRSRDVRVLAGAFGYWAFDNAVLWATFHAFGLSRH